MTPLRFSPVAACGDLCGAEMLVRLCGLLFSVEKFPPALRGGLGFGVVLKPVCVRIAFECQQFPQAPVRVCRPVISEENMVFR